MRSRNFSNPMDNEYSEAFERQKQLVDSQEDFSKPQEIICNFFLRNVKKESPDWLLQHFDNLFISQSPVDRSETHQSLYLIIGLNQEKIFRDTLKRCCYILINNWCAARYHQYIQKLVKLFSQVSSSKKSISPLKRRLREWLKNFFDSEDYQELTLFVSKYNNRDKERWSNRYASYLLTSQFLDSSKLREQREAARVVARQLKEQFKFDLAMYTARYPWRNSVTRHENPTLLGDDVLRLIQTILTRHRVFSHANIANIFIKQVDGLQYKHFKKALIKYLLFSLEKNESSEALEIYLLKHIDHLYESYNEDVLNPNLILRTCNRLIEYLTTHNQGQPSQLFTWLALQGKYITLVIILLKIILVSKNSYVHLEFCIGYLVQHYENQSETECKWFIDFLETLNIILAICAENIRYNLVNMNTKLSDIPTNKHCNSYRIFSQVKVEREKAFNMSNTVINL
jgi:hypothetical protein